MKPLDKTAVAFIAEELMAKYGSTTTLDVKNLLRNRGYQAMQAEVSRWMDDLAREEAWAFSQQNSYRVYRLGPDSNETYQKYLEKGNDFWEIKVEQKEQTVAEGKVGTNGAFFQKPFSTNRQAIRHAKNLVQEKLQAGFHEAIDKRLPIHIRQKFGKYLDLKPIKCTLGFFDVEIIEKQSADFQTTTGKQSGFLLKTKNGGYQFTWQENFSQIADNLQANDLDLLHSKYVNLRKIGEKILKQEPQTLEAVVLSDCQSVDNQGDTSLEKMLAQVKNLYQAEFQFENGEKTTLNKFDLKFEEEFLPLTKQILQN